MSPPGLGLLPAPRSPDPFPPLDWLEPDEELPPPDDAPASVVEGPVDFGEGAASACPSPLEPLLAREVLEPELVRESVE